MIMTTMAGGDAQERIRLGEKAATRILERDAIAKVILRTGGIESEPDATVANVSRSPRNRLPSSGSSPQRISPGLFQPTG